MPQFFVTTIKGKDFRDRGERKGPHVMTIVEGIYRRILKEETAFIKSYYLDGGTTSTTIRSRSGRLKKNTNYYVTKTGSGGISGKIAVGEGVPYASLHVSGTKETKTITPMHGTHLAVPLPNALTAKGDLIAKFRGLKSLRDAKSLRRVGGVLAEVKGQSFTPYFALKRFVTVPTRVPLDVIMQDVKQKLQLSIVEALKRTDITQIRAGMR